MDSNQYGNYPSENGSNSETQPNQPNNVNYYDIPSEQNSADDFGYGQGESYQDPYGQRSGSYNLNGKQYNYGDAYQNDIYQNNTYQSNSNGAYQNNGYQSVQNANYQSNHYQSGGYQQNNQYAAYQNANGKTPPFTLYIVFSVIEMVFSTVFGIIALVCSILGMQQYQRGDQAGGRSKLKVAKIILIIGLVFGILSILIMCLAFILTSGVGSAVTDINEPSVYSELGGDDEKMSELSSDWQDFKVALDGEVYELPCKTEQLTDNGWVLDEDYKDSVVEAGYFKPVRYLKGDYQIVVEIVNFDSEEKGAADCMVGGFSIEGRYVNDGLTFSICRGVSLGTDMEKAELILGKPDDEYIGEENGYWEDYRSWTYYNHDDTYQSARLTLIDYQITSIEIQNLNEE